MHFRMLLGLAGLRLSPEHGDPVVFEYAESPQVIVTIGLGPHVLGTPSDHNDPLCVVSTSVTVDSAVEEVCWQLGQGKVPPEYLMERKQYEAHGITPDRSILPGRRLPLQYFPSGFRKFESDLWDRLYWFAARTIKVLRWRLGMPGPRSPFRYSILQCSVDDNAWRTLPVVSEHFPEALPDILIPVQLRDEVTRLVARGNSEPIGFELFHEAWAHGTVNPRSALVLAMAAAEVGCKDLIKSLAPDAGWLVQNVPSPELFRLLRDYLPLLRARNAFSHKVFVPAALYNAVKKGSDVRNKAVHKGDAVPKETLHKTLVAVRDLLWLFEFYKGSDWATEHLTTETKSLVDAARNVDTRT